jgi:lipopolysaccharide export system protein LptA
MVLDVRQLRKWLLSAAGLLVVVVLCFYLYGRWRLRSVLRTAPARLGVNIERASQGFSLSKSENGRTLFTIRAAKAIEYKAGGHARLEDVNIIIYGKTGDRFDQISGSDFEYDPATGDVVAHGDVQIDLEANTQGPFRPDQAPPKEQKNLIHVNTSGLTFNQKTGIAITKQRVEFRIPQAEGSAVGAIMDAHADLLHLESAVELNGTGAKPAKVIAESAVLTKLPRQAVLEAAHITQDARIFDADKLIVFFTEDNHIDHMHASGNVHGSEVTGSDEQYEVHAPEAEFSMGAQNKLRSIVTPVGAVMDSTGAQLTHGTAHKAVVDFDDQQRAKKVHAEGDVHFSQHKSAAAQRAKAGSESAQNTELIADAVDAFPATAPGQMGHAETSGAARIELEPQGAAGADPPGKTVVTAAKFHATFDAQNRMRALHGEPDAKIVSPGPTPSAPPRVSTSQMLDVLFDQTRSGGVESIVQKVNLHYHDGTHQAFAAQGRYTPADQMLVLAGSPRVQDEQSTTSANVIRMNRATGDALAEDNVKSTYRQTRQQPNGAMLASGDPVHVTAHSLSASKSTGIAHYTGDARLWQDANILESPILDFERQQRLMAAQGTAAHPVTSEFVQIDAKGQQSPVHITAAHFTYADDQRKAHYEDNVIMTSDQGRLTAGVLDIFLKPAQQHSSGSQAQQHNTPQSSGPSQIDHAVASGKVLLVQPGRRATGERLVYTADDQKYVLSGTPQQLPEVDDVQRGTTRGDRLTFFRDEDKVLVESASKAPAVTRTPVK